MSKQLPLAESLQHLVGTYGRTPLAQLVDNEQFKQDALMNGRNRSNLLVRRYSFRNSTVVVEKESDGVVLIREKYGYDGLKTIYTVEREVVKHDPAQPVVVFAKTDSVTLGELEATIRSSVNVGDWTVPEAMRDTPISFYLTPESPYTASFGFTMDTLSTYAEFSVVVMLDYIYIADAVKELTALYHKRTGVVLPDVFDIRKDCQNDYTVAQQYRDQMESK